MMKRAELIPIAVDSFRKMTLHVFLAGEDYRGTKPDIVIVHAEKKKYYLAEIVTDECLNGTERLMSNRPDNACRRMCGKLHEDSREAALAAALYCDLGQGIDLFRYAELKGFLLSRMQKYAAMFYPKDIAPFIEKSFTKFKLQYKSLIILDKYSFALFSRSDTNRLAEARKFMRFMIANKPEES